MTTPSNLALAEGRSLPLLFTSLGASADLGLLAFLGTWARASRLRLPCVAASTSFSLAFALDAAVGAVARVRAVD